MTNNYDETQNFLNNEEANEEAIFKNKKEEGRDNAANEDPIKIYMREMGAIERFTREEELLTAQKMDNARSDMVSAILRIPTIYPKILQRYDEEQQSENIDIGVLSKTIYSEGISEEEIERMNEMENLIGENDIELEKVTDCEEIHSLVDKIRGFVDTFSDKNEVEYNVELAEEICSYNLNYMSFVVENYDYMKEVSGRLKSHKSKCLGLFKKDKTSSAARRFICSTNENCIKKRFKSFYWCF